MSCNNPKWKSYIGFTDSFEYCEVCGEKKKNHKDHAAAIFDAVQSAYDLGGRVVPIVRYSSPQAQQLPPSRTWPFTTDLRYSIEERILQAFSHYTRATGKVASEGNLSVNDFRQLENDLRGRIVWYTGNRISISTMVCQVAIGYDSNISDGVIEVIVP